MRRAIRNKRNIRNRRRLAIVFALLALSGCGLSDFEADATRALDLNVGVGGALVIARDLPLFDAASKWRLKARSGHAPKIPSP